MQQAEEVLEFPGGIRSASDASRYFADATGSPLEGWCISQKLAPNSSVLDVGCGAGRYALDLQFAQPTLDVRGLEISPAASRIANDRGLSTTCIDFRDAKFRNEFDAVMFLGNNLGLLGYGSRITRLLDFVRGWMRDSAVLVGTAGKPTLLPEALRGQVDVESPGTFRARNIHGQDSGDWFEYTFMTFDYFHNLLPRNRWTVVDTLENENRWAVQLMAI